MERNKENRIVKTSFNFAIVFEKEIWVMMVLHFKVSNKWGSPSTEPFSMFKATLLVIPTIQELKNLRQKWKKFDLQIIFYFYNLLMAYKFVF